MSYKVEELLALRDSVSESAVSIDKFPDEDVIKGECCYDTVLTIPPPLTPCDPTVSIDVEPLFI